MKVYIGEKIREIRDRLGIDQRMLAEILCNMGLQISNSAISYYECNKRHPSFELLIALCQIGGVTPNYFLGYDDDNPKDINGRAISSIDRAHSAYTADVAVRLTETWQNRRKINMVCINNRRA